MTIKDSRFSFHLTCLVSGLLLIFAPTLYAQSSTIILSLVIPPTQKDRFTDTLVADFEAQHPDVELNLVEKQPPALESELTNPQAYLDGLFDYITSGDLVFIFDAMMSPMATQAGYFLDLNPLIAADPNLKAENYYAPFWQSYQWDGGTWAIPYAGVPILLGYNAPMFDAANIAYPTGDWTTAQSADAARKLTQYNADGHVVAPGLLVPPGIPEQALLRILLGQKLYDETTQPITPQLNSSEIAAFVELWAGLQSEGIVSNDVGDGFTPAMQIMNLGSPFTDSSEIQWTLLPGDTVAVQSQGFAVNAGTANPEFAYALAAFLSNRPELVGTGRLSAVRNLVDNMQPDPEQHDLVQAGLEKGLPFNELLYMDYLTEALSRMHNPDADAHTILADLQTQALNAQHLAMQYRTTRQPYVTLPEGILALPTEEITLNFALSTLFPPQQLPDQNLWNQAAEEFVSIDPEVGHINLENVQLESLDEMAQNNDCFTSLFNLVNSSNIGLLRNVDPLLASDATFNTGDVIGDSLQQVTIADHIWGILLSIQAGVIVYDTQQFTAANMTFPPVRWNINDFLTTLQGLSTATSKAPFWPSGGGRNYVLPLIAAYGGLPINYQTEPPTLNFTAPETIAAIEQAFHLVKEGYLYYVPLIPTRIRRMPAWYGPPLNDSLLEYLQFSKTQNREGYAAYPAGSQYRGIPMSLTVGYISAQSAYPEACYRWLSFIRTRPELIQGMPVYRSLMDAPALLASRSEEMIKLYHELASALDESDTIRFPLFEEDIVTGMVLLRYWLYNAIDLFVLKDQPLENTLPQAQADTEDFLVCVGKLPAAETQLDQTTQIVDCARQVDPGFAGF